MVNLFELMQRAQGGDAVQAMARQFGLSPPQAESAVDALLPAFAIALQRALQDPAAAMRLMATLAQAQQQALLATAAQALSPERKEATPGIDAMAAFFGSGELARAIAAQAAAASGLAPQTMQQLMPAMAGMLAAGLARSMAEGGFAAMFAPMMAGFGAGAPQAGLAGGLAAYQEMMTRMMQAAMAPAEPRPEPRPEPAAAPFDPAAFAAMMGRMFGAPQPEAAAEPEPEPPPPPPTSSDLGYEALSRMVETGRAAQEEQVKAMQGLFNRMMESSGKP
ncbi:DUF937 domain-containing protein [Alsobacter sp. SYSU M60028]|uniref:DUF937 domain-containing protein n=1 Tax=Alsobacter ponti TaxID=2962936 RepID=A0ABT1LE56_9HYPH|nr:DUF937 domain-containing protein [Alsobacter ponti]MCP8939201.1 DUF937 domain-containing protein [Alsobacter ponti]